MKKRLHFILFSSSLLATTSLLFTTSCGTVDNPYEGIKEYDSFEISTIENAMLLEKISENKLPVEGAREIAVADLPSFSSPQQYWEVILYCQSKILSGEIDSYKITCDIAKPAETKVIINNSDEYTIVNLGATAINNRVCWDQKIGDENPISWMFVNYKVNP